MAEILRILRGGFQKWPRTFVSGRVVAATAAIKDYNEPWLTAIKRRRPRN